MTETSSSDRWAPPTVDELAALDALGRAGIWELQGTELKLTNLDKVLFPGRDGGPAVTKRDLVRYDATVAPLALPYLHDRPVNLHRFPAGVTEPGFWHKAVPDHAPDWLTRWHYESARSGDTRWYFVIDSPAAMKWMANYGAVELHPWTSTAAHPHQPTWALIDLDPGTTTTFDELLVLARLHRTALEHVRSRRPGEARLHPERRQQDPRGPVEHEGGDRRPRLRSDHLGRARRSRPDARPLDPHHHRRPPHRRRRSSGAARRARTRAASPVGASYGSDAG